MAAPRFAPTGPRSKFGGQSFGGQSFGGGAFNEPPRPKNPLVQSARQKVQRHYDQLGKTLDTDLSNTSIEDAMRSTHGQKDPVGFLKEMNLTDEEISAVAPLIGEAAKRPKALTALGIAGKVLGAPEAATASVVRGLTDPKYGGDVGLIDIIRDPSEAKKVTPWAMVHSLNAGFKDIPKAMTEGYTFENLIKERNNPDSFAYRHSMPIGLTLSIFADPTMYLSLGATTPSKIAARNLLARTWRESAIDAQALIDRKVLKPGTQRPWQPHEHQDLVGHIHLEKGRPMDLGDALDHVREIGLERKAAARAGKGRARRMEALKEVEPEYAKKLEGRKIRGALSNRAEQALGYIAPTNVKGGRGVRFAGKQIPGTGRAGSYLGEKARAVSRKGIESPVGPIPAGFVPHAGMRHIAHDGLRAGAGAEISVLAEAVRRTPTDMQDTWQAILKGTPAGYTQPVDEILDFEQRAGILDPAKHRWLTADQKAVASHLREQVQHAKRVHLSRTKTTDEKLQRKWHKAQAKYADPVEATARFITELETSFLKKQHIRNILTDPRFAYELPTAKGKVRAPHIREGFESWEYAGKQYAVLKPIRTALVDFHNTAIGERELSKFIQAINAPQNWWKVLATVPNPAFHVMNFVGAQWNNALMGVYNPGDTVHALGTLYRSRLEAAAEAGEISWMAPRQALKGEAPISTPLTKESAQIVEEAGQRGGLGRGQFIWELTEAMEREQRRGGAPAGTAAAERGKAVGRRLVKPGPEQKAIPLTGGKGKKARFAATRARQGAAIAGIPATAGLSLLAATPELARAGRAVGGTIEDMVRLTAFQKAARDPDIQRALEAFGPIRIPGTIKAGGHPGFTKEEQSVMYDIGAEHAKHFQFDYTDLTQVERFLAKSVFPFYTYYRKNFVLQAKELVKQPRKIAMAQAMMDYISEQGDYGDMPDEFKAILPEYFDNLAAFQIPVPTMFREKLGLPKDQPLFLNPKMPFVALNLFPPFWQLFQDTDTPRWQKLGAVMAPTMGMVGPWSLIGGSSKIAIEAMVGYEAGLNRPIDFSRAQSGDWRESHVPAPAWSKYLPKFMQDFLLIVEDKHGQKMMNPTTRYIVDQVSSPFISNFGSAVPIATGNPESDARANADLFSYISGVRLMPADPHKLGKNYAYRIRNMLRARKSELEFQGKDLSEEDQNLLDMATDATEIAEDVEDTRNAELYPDDEEP